MPIWVANSRVFVTEIANSANTTGASTDQVTNFSVKILLLEESYKDLVDSVGGKIYPFRPGMSATVDIQTENQKKCDFCSDSGSNYPFAKE